MKATELIHVGIYCNDPQTGNFLGYLTGFDIDELQVGFVLDASAPEFFFEGNYLVAGSEKFYVVDRARHVGNFVWDQVTMPAEAVCRLLNWARKNDYQADQIPTRFSEVWNSEKPIQMNHLDLLF